MGGKCLCWLGSQGLFPAWLPLGPTSPLNMGRISPLPGLRQPPWASVTCNIPNPQQRVVAGRLRNLLSRLSSHPWKRKEGEGCGTSWGDWAPAQCCRPEAPGKTLLEGFTDLSGERPTADLQASPGRVRPLPMPSTVFTPDPRV